MPNNGNQPSCTANRICKNSAATYDGNEYSMYKSTLAVRSAGVLARTVDHSPSGIASRYVSTSDDTVSISVGPIRVAMSRDTGSFREIDRPRSNCPRFFAHTTYPCGQGLSRP